MPRSPRHEAALAYARGGIPVFPCQVDGKKPATPRGVNDATLDPDQINAWWSQGEDFNVAIVPERAGMCVVDVDGPEGKATWEMLELAYGETPTKRVETPRGGFHLYFKGSLPPTVQRIGPHIDTRGGNSYALAPPSVVGGRPYITVGGEVAPLPEWIARLAQKPDRKVEVPDGDVYTDLVSARAWLAANPPATRGNGADQQALVAAMILRDFGLNQAQSLELLEAWQNSDNPEWLPTKVENAWKYAENDPGSKAIPPASETFAGYAESGTPEDSPWRVWTLPEIEALPPQRWLIEDILPADGIIMIYGPTNTGKTFAAISMTMPLAQAGERVLFIAGEGKRQVGHRAAVWARVNTFTPGDYQVLPRMPLARNVEDAKALVKHLRAISWIPSVLVIDTNARMMSGLDENSAQDVGLLVEALDYLRHELGCAIILIHHTGKDVGRGARGHSALLAAVDTSFELENAEDVSAFALHMRRQRDAAILKDPLCYAAGPPVEKTLVFMPITPEEWRKLIDKSDPRLHRPAVSAALRELGAVEGTGVTVTVHTLAKVICGPDATDTDLAQVRRCLNALAKTSLMSVCPDGKKWSTV